MLLALEYGNVWLGLLTWATPASLYLRPLWWQTFAVTGLLGVFLAFVVTLEVKLLQTTISNVDGIKFRSQATPGCWCCLLLPLISLSCWSAAEPKPSEAYWPTVLVGLGLLGASLLWIQALAWRRSISTIKTSQAAVKQTFWQVMALALVVAVAMAHLWQIDIATALTTSLASHSLFCIMVLLLPKAFPSSFTLGESILWAQGGSLFIVTAVGDLVSGIRGAEPFDQYVAVTHVAEVVLLSCFLVMGLLLAVPGLRHPLTFYGLWMATVLVMVLPLTAYLLKQNPVIWLFKFLLATNLRICLFFSWILLTFLAVLVVAYQQFVGNRASTVTRKLFHALILLVYIPGLAWDSELLRLASLLAFAVFLVLECVRVLQIPPLGSLLNHSLHVFLDEKDGGLLILTPIYLLIGCSMPIWLDPRRSVGTSKSLAPWSGILSLGIGDTVASVAGTALGYHRWPQTKKTVEGTGLAILAQYMVVTFLGTAGYWPAQLPSLRSSLVIVISSLMEAFTSQVDNLVVPLWTFLMFSSV